MTITNFTNQLVSVLIILNPSKYSCMQAYFLKHKNYCDRRIPRL
jgi:hypothetical protein